MASDVVASVSSVSYLYSAPVIAVTYAIMCLTGARYNGTLLYFPNTNSYIYKYTSFITVTYNWTCIIDRLTQK